MFDKIRSYVTAKMGGYEHAAIDALTDLAADWDALVARVEALEGKSRTAKISNPPPITAAALDAQAQQSAAAPQAPAPTEASTPAAPDAPQA